MSYLLYINSTEQQLWRKTGSDWQRWSGEPDSTVWVVTDLPEESFTDLKTPRLIGRDRSAFIARQLATTFPDTLYRSYLTPVQDDSLLGAILPTRQILFGVSAAERLNTALASIKAPIAGVWPMSMLLANMCKRKELPADLLIALPGPDTLRIVYLRKRSPVIARLTSTPNLAGAQVEELIRTLRYLENAQVLQRDRKLHSVLFLGDNSGLEGLVTSANLKLVNLRQKKTPPADWRFALFDIAVKSPSGQVAPMDRRVDYLAQQLGKASIAAAIILLMLGIGIAAINLFAVFGMRTQQLSLDASAEELSAKIATNEKAISRFNVAPDLVRRAIALSDKEITSVPPMEQHFHLIASLLANDPNLRLSSLHWRILAPGVLPCSAATDVTQSEAGAEAAAAGSETRRVEINFEIALPDAYGPRDRASTLRNISTHIAGSDGVTVWKDAIKDFTGGSLRGGSVTTATGNASWCITLPGTVAAMDAKPAEMAGGAKP